MVVLKKRTKSIQTATQNRRYCRVMNVLIRVAFGSVVFLSIGCAFFSKKTPSPAARIDKDELARRPPPPGVRYFAILFGSENDLRQARYSHTWATLVRVEQTSGQSTPAVDSSTISWMPATLDIRPLRLRVEPGVNLGLQETIRLVQSQGQRVEMWGPYEIWHGTAHRFEVQHAFLDSGAVGYQCFDTLGEAARRGNGCDCIHAVSDMDPDYPRWRYPLAAFGPSAAATDVRRLMHAKATIDGGHTHDWLLEPLGLTDPSLIRRQYRGRVLPYEPKY